MMKPLALVFYERLMPGSQLINRLQDLGYRVQTVSEASQLSATARREKPMVAIVDLVTGRADICTILREIREDAETSHIPVIGFAGPKETKLHEEASSCTTLVAHDDALLPQLPHLLEHALQVY